MPLVQESLLLSGSLQSLDALQWRKTGACEAQELVDRAALGAFYARHAPAIHRFLCDLLGDAALASDATQETFVRAFQRLRTLQDPSKPGPWLFGIARNVSRELRKSRRRSQRTFVCSNQHAHRVQGGGSPEGELLGREAVRVVGAALEALSEDRKAALLLRLDHGLAYDQIAQLMGWSLAKVKVEIFRAREQLRAAVDAYEGGVP